MSGQALTLQHRLLFCATGARRRVEVVERGPFSQGYRNGLTDRGYMVRGAGVRDGSLYTEDWDADATITAAVACFRRHNPKARLFVTVCTVCNPGRTGLSLPECKHVASTPAVEPGR